MKLHKIDNCLLFNLTLFLSLARFTSITLKTQLVFNILFTVIYSLMQNNTLMLISSPVQLYLLSQYQLDKDDLSALGIYSGTVLFIIYITQLDVLVSKLMSDFFVRCFRFFSYLFFIKSLIPYELKNYDIDNSFAVVLLMAVLIYVLKRYYGGRKIPHISLFILGIFLYVAIEQILSQSTTLGPQKATASIGFHSSEVGDFIDDNKNGIFSSFANLSLLPFIHSELKLASMVKFIVFPIYTTFETLIAFKTLNLKYNERRIWFFWLSLVNFFSGLFGLHCTNIPVLLNRKLEDNAKNKQAKLLLMLASLVLFGLCPERILFALKYNLFIYTSLLGLLLYYTFDGYNANNLFKKGKTELVLIMATFLSAMVTESVFISCFMVFIVEWVIYTFKADFIGNATIMTSASGKNRKYELADWHDDVTIYKLEGCMNFLRTNYHIRRILSLDCRIVVVDFENVIEKYDRDFTDSYSDFINKASKLHSKIIVIYGIGDSPRWNIKDKYF